MGWTFYTSASTGPVPGDVITYPGFVEDGMEVEMVVDKGLTQEILLRCDVRGGRNISGIMVYSKIDDLFCSSQNRCYRDVEVAASETCGW